MENSFPHHDQGEGKNAIEEDGGRVGDDDYNYHHTDDPSPSSETSRIIWKYIYLFSILCYIVCNAGLLYVNLTQTQDEIEANIYLPFHFTSFWSTFLFTLVEGVVLYHTTKTTTTTTTGTGSSTTQKASPRAATSSVPYWTLGLTGWNMISTFGVALLFTVNPTRFERISHIVEYILQIFMSIIDVVIVVVLGLTNSFQSLLSIPPPTQPSDRKDGDDDNKDPILMCDINNSPIPVRPVAQLELHHTRMCTKHREEVSSRNFVGAYSTPFIVGQFLMAISVLLLSILTYLYYTTIVDDDDVATTTTWRVAMVVYMGGPEHAAHTMEFITEIGNGIFVFVFTYFTVH